MVLLLHTERFVQSFKSTTVDVLQLQNQDAQKAMKLTCLIFQISIRLAHVGGILNGTAGVCVCVIPSVISALWFPPGQRTTATGIFI